MKFQTLRTALGTVLLLLLSAGALSAQEIQWRSMSEAQELALENDKKVLIFAEAVWCTYCKKMNKEVFPKASIVETVNKHFYAVRVDIESDRPLTFNGEKMTEAQFGYKYRVRSTPTTFFVEADGEIIGGQPGFLPAEIFDVLLTYIGTEAYSRVEFKEYLEDSGAGK